MTVSTEDVRALLDCQETDAVLVLIEGRAEVVTPTELDSPDYRGALQITTREQLIEQAGGAELSDRELAEQAEDLDSAVRNLGS
jgi:predicted ATP-grasp superfamily ATP-dependent carboligase